MSRTVRPALAVLALAFTLVLGACGGSKRSGPTPPPQTCTDGAQNGTETGVDCGGDCVTTCAIGIGCAAPDDCTSGFCNPTTSLCAAPTCSDGFDNGSETAIDCGGPDCLALSTPKTCADGQGCGAGADCSSGFCHPTAHTCAAITCADGFKNGSETDLDCGGSCPDCSNGLACAASTDCASDFCNPTTQVCAAPACGDGFQNGAETDVDCGGAACLALATPRTCAAGAGCGAAADCATGFCNPTTHLCAAPACGDGFRNGGETDVDCGGAACLALATPRTCAAGAGCGAGADCASGFCHPTSHTCAAVSCTDGFKNGSESAVDCGGSCPNRCANGSACGGATDCTSDFCNPTTQLCAAPACGDGFKNGAETDVDCGGAACLALATPRTCAAGAGCGAAADCATGFCNPTTHLCAVPACGDGFKNGTETDVDCGGGCPAQCLNGRSCAIPADCASGTCDPNSKVCTVACTPNGTACPTGGGACCSGFCDGSNQCAEPCRSNGASCAGNGDCCTGNCTGSPLSCQPPASCTANGLTCTVDDACCSGSCNGSGLCADPCRANGAGCSFNSDCCSTYCDPGKVCGTRPVCKPDGLSCSSDANCCNGYCNPLTQQCATPTSTCTAAGASCTAGPECCSKACNNPTGATGAGTCTTTAFCKSPGAACASPSECCSQACVGGLCANTSCKTTGAACASADECCTGSCATTCQVLAVPSGTSACKTLGDACAAGAECCSTNCQGGTCTPAYTCHATSDICYRNEDCCSGMCSAPSPQTSPLTPGRCLVPSGGCKQDGSPCTGASNCCTRLCKDLGSGVAVCQPASGCRMTGDYCDRTEACCGGSPDSTNPGGYGVFCDSPGTSPSAPQLDTSTKDDRTCTGGQACNPPGNICGGSGAVPASQNCCDGKKAVCKQDSNGIYRCFGGGHLCPGGYDANNPACCIPAGDVCQFRDQCCNSAPCVPDAAGVLRCTVSTCTAVNGPCAGADDGSCCAGTVCTYESGPGSFSCKVPTSCTQNGQACDVASDCCSSNCVSGTCAPPCTAAEGACTTNGDCCTGLACSIPPGATSGTCTSASSCAPTGGSCGADADCCSFAAGERCLSGRCAVPQTCQPQLQSCSTSAECCAQSPALSCIAGDGTVCNGGEGCVCDSCKAATQGCSGDADCCLGLVCNGGTCQACATVSGSCTNASSCCSGLTCADTSSGEPCAGGSCTCEVCVPLGNSCTAGGATCCGSGTVCLDPNFIDCALTEGLDCICQPAPG